MTRQWSEVTVPRALTVDEARPRTPECETGACAHYREMVQLRRNLHDGLGPGLAGIMLRADILAKLMTANQDAAEEMLRELRHETAAFMTEFRRVLADQSPAELDGQALDDALRALARRMSRATGGSLTVTVDADPHEPAEIDRTAQVAAFWIAKEALTNVVKHARARHCEIRVRAHDGLHMSIVDDGVGGANLGRRGVGLTSMGSRAAELGGWCEVTDGATPGTGVRVTAYLPAALPTPRKE
ncbi:sensor histidine kinase [Actinophytocola sp.]|uniref:sensor histidine kinase n=1 Tax=Actinophytocola sp. TaxID=1872138 RepID=UPI003D6B065D